MGPTKGLRLVDLGLRPNSDRQSNRGSLMVGQYALYRYFDTSDHLLYVGKSGALARREATHISRSHWMQFAARSAFERFGTPEELGDAERRAIMTEGPIFNRQYNDTPEAAERLRAYLEEVGRLDLLPVRLRVVRATEPMVEQDALADATEEDLLDLLRRILTADTADHAKVRLRAVAVLEGYADLPRGADLELLAELAKMSRSRAYEARNIPFPLAR